MSPADMPPPPPRTEIRTKVDPRTEQDTERPKPPSVIEVTIEDFRRSAAVLAGAVKRNLEATARLGERITEATGSGRLSIKRFAKKPAVQ